MRDNETKKHILEVGRQFLAREGFSGVGLMQILKEAGVPKGSFYHYFDSKEQFGAEILNDYFSEYSILLGDILNDESLNGLDTLLHYFGMWVETQGDKDSDRKCLVVKLSAEVSDLSEIMRVSLLNGTTHIQEQIAACIDRGIKDGSIKKIDSAKTATTLYSIWLGSSLISKIHKCPSSLIQSLITTKEMLRK